MSYVKPTFTRKYHVSYLLSVNSSETLSEERFLEIRKKAVSYFKHMTHVDFEVLGNSVNSSSGVQYFCCLLPRALAVSLDWFLYYL